MYSFALVTPLYAFAEINRTVAFERVNFVVWKQTGL